VRAGLGDNGSMILEHLGKLHGYEQVLVLLLAFGPVLLLGVTIWIARRRVDHDD
jgi:hypothetical protein